MPRPETTSALPGSLLLGFALGSIGGPLALGSLFFAGAAGDALPGAGFVSLLALAAFVSPLAIWWRYSAEIASAGGLYAFVEAAVGRRVARAQGAVWIVSYGLYVPYTVTYVVYELLPAVVPGVASYRWELELLLPVGIVLCVLAPLERLLLGVLAIAAAQIGLMLALGGLAIGRFGAPGSSFLPQAGAATVGKGVGNVSLLFLCASLPLFLGGEARGGGRAVRRVLLAAFLLVGAALPVEVFPLAASSRVVRDAAIPGLELAQLTAGRPFALAVGFGTIASVGFLIVAELIALSRLLHAMAGRSPRTWLVRIAPLFLLADCLSLIDPQAFYDRLLQPSLVALYVSQLPVFLAFPLLRRRTGVRAGDVLLAALASALMAYGLYTVAVDQLGIGT